MINNFMKKLILLLVLFCTGCAGISFRHTEDHLYITGDGLPTITNDKEFGRGFGSQYKLSVDKKLEFQYKYNF